MRPRRDTSHCRPPTGFLAFKIPEIFAYEQCRRRSIDCRDLRLDTDFGRYEQVWELPIYVAAFCSVIARMVTFAMLRRASYAGAPPGMVVTSNDT